MKKKTKQNVGIFVYTPVNVDISGLSDTMASVLCLCIHSRIPIGIVENDCIGTG